MQSLSRRVFIPFAAFIALFFGTGFVAGSIVHMGEGINPWDVSLFGIGVMLFVAGSVAHDVLHGSKRLKEEGIALFLLLSLILSIGIGMASGGFQHFDDTPHYSAILIPLGVGLGLIAYVLKERISLTKKEWIALLPLTVVSMLLLSVALKLAAGALPESVRGGHGHGAGSMMSSDASSMPDAGHASEGHGH